MKLEPSKGSKNDEEASSNDINGILMLAFLIIGGIAATWSSIVYFDLMNIPARDTRAVATSPSTTLQKAGQYYQSSSARLKSL